MRPNSAMYARPTAVSPSSWIVPRVHGLHEVVPDTLQPLDPDADLLPADELGDVGDPPRAVLREQRGEAVVVAHHSRVGELAAQRLDLEAVSDGLNVAHWFPSSSVFTTRPPPAWWWRSGGSRC